MLRSCPPIGCLSVSKESTGPVAGGKVQLGLPGPKRKRRDGKEEKGIQHVLERE